MTPGVVALPAQAPIHEVARALRAHHVHAILVVSSKDGSPLGWAMADTMRHWRGSRAEGATAADAITEKVSGIVPAAGVQAVLYALSMPGVTRLVVRERGTGFPIGVITDYDLVDPSGFTKRG